MPTYGTTEQFDRDLVRLSPEQREQFRTAVRKFVEDLESGLPPRFRRGLRVKPMQDARGVFEMTWEISDGRATFEFGDLGSVIEGEVHVIWRRIGPHSVFKRP